MHTIRSVEVAGFRGQQKLIKIDLNRRANFVIGRNGTGKTTFINLLNAAISADTDVLRRTEFKSITLRLREDGNRRVPSIGIVKDNSAGAQSIIYNIRESSASEPKNYFALRQGLRRVRTSSGQIINVRDDLSTDDTSGPKELIKRLSSLYRTTWLSLQRAKDEPDDEPEEFHDYGSDVDKRLAQVFVETTRYFSRLDGQVADKTIEFQKQWFLSFLSRAGTYKGIHTRAEI